MCHTARSCHVQYCSSACVCCAHICRCVYVCRSVDDSGVVFLHQTHWQMRMLCLYGSHMCLIDATYKTNVYDMPLFFLCVPTNVGYVNTASFLLTDERQESITSALLLIRTWNPEWCPSHFLTDFHEGQINALESAFPGASLRSSNIMNCLHSSCYIPTDMSLDLLRCWPSFPKLHVQNCIAQVLYDISTQIPH